MISKVVIPVSQASKAYQNFSIRGGVQRSLSLACTNFNQLSQKGQEKKDKSVPAAKLSKDHDVSDWMKSIQKEDERPPINYRRQDYPDPLSRTYGILRDDLLIFFGNIYAAFKHVIGSITSNNTKDEQSKETKTKTTSQARQFSAGNTSGKKQTRFFKTLAGNKPQEWPSHCDFLIIGGGAVGSSVAYHLTKKISDGASVVVVDKDLTYKNSSTVLSVGGIRHQFSVPENILLSMYGMQFMRDLPQMLKVPYEDPPCVNFHPHGYLTLASEKGLDQLKENYAIQKHFNARVEFLEAKKLREKFPWMRSDDLAGGVLGVEGEGWFDPWSLLTALRRKAVHQSAEYVEAEVTGVEFVNDSSSISFVDGHPSNSQLCIRKVNVKLPNGEQRTISPALVVLAAGAQTGNICYDMIGIGRAREGLMAYPVPIEPRKRYVYCFHAPKGPGLATPLVVDPCGAYFRREGFGNMFLAGMSPTEEEEPPCDNFEVDHDYFEDRVWPAIANRVPGFEELKVQGSWSGFYEYNIFDQNGIVGMHPIVDNLMLAAGFSGHGIQHSMGVGRAVMELLMYSEFRTIDLSRFELERIHLNEPIYEHGIV
ncbi:FAD dependent oxidoreductase [Trinorchestia longiramus]|nr:FAD dependent oxidoreductase [Trinorchestia longiramus]